ncbi:MAG: transcriptional regulator [SAR86 cluster bacterium]|uniref:Transcriptional regulator n=1 Tax=SAR86 cluster bacterium TaxID=2030880 RepID=A0A2A5BA61_9GAMM|nr:MAG: transcriptional regulator [SAR86 cluster bacterium]
MPFLYQPQEQTLLGHMAKANPHWQQLEKQNVLIVLQGPHAYISPSWYLNPGVPTWNYQAVHIYGRATCFQDSEKLKNIVDRLTAENEAAFDKPWKPDYEATMLRGIVGIKIEIEDIQCKFKLNQNRDIDDQKNVSTQLRLIGETALAKAMEDEIGNS